MGPVMGYKYHKMCFRCHTCDRLLDFITFRTNLIDLHDRQLYCVNHHPRNGKYTDSYTYRTGSKSPAHFEVIFCFLICSINHYFNNKILENNYLNRKK